MSPNNKSAGALRKAAYAAGALSLAVAGILITVPGASADDSTCTPMAAYDEQVLVTPAVPGTPGTPAVTHLEPLQRYAWTGGPDGPGEGDVPPSDNWQANTEHYKDGDPLGTPYQAGTPGNSDWFYWTTEEVVDTPAVPGTPDIPAVYKTVHHDAVTCPATVVTPPTEVTPPAPVEEPTHTVPTTVQTDGDTSWMPVAAGGLGALAAASLGGAGLLMRGRRS